DGELQWLHSFRDLAGDGKKAWVNVAPISAGVGAGPEGGAVPRAVLVGLASGAVVALDRNGERLDLFSTDANGVLLDCRSVEDPSSRVLQTRSAKAVLSGSPYFDPGGAPWWNSYGVASGMMVAQERLLTGVNELNGRSRMVALRMGVNLQVKSVTFTQENQPRTADQIDAAKPFTAAVTLSWFVPGGGRLASDVPVLFGWMDAAPGPVQWITAGDGAQATTTTLTFEMLPRTDGHHSADLLALANPGLYYKRHVSRQPQGRTDVEAVPQAWESAASGYTGIGEVEVGDNWFSIRTGRVGAPQVTLQVSARVCTGEAVAYQVDYDDPQGLPMIAQEPEQWPPPPSYETPGTVTVRYRAQNAGKVWSDWVQADIAVVDCVDRRTPTQWFDITFDPAVGHRGHRIMTTIDVRQPAELAGHPLDQFTVDKVRVDLPRDLQYLAGVTAYSRWDAPNDDPRAAGAGLHWTYPFDLPAPSNNPPDGSYRITVYGAGTYTYTEWHANWECDAYSDVQTGVDPATRQPITVKQCSHYVDNGHSDTHTLNWDATEEQYYQIEGGHEYVHPITDYGP
ncbi:MAG: hypothetical protein ACM3XM_03390, partial [Mycobacterium leprae]